MLRKKVGVAMTVSSSPGGRVAIPRATTWARAASTARR
jgi:hypothetical protein